MTNIDNDITEVVETLLEKAWVKYQRGDALGAQKLALQAYRLQPEIETNPNVSPYLEQMFANYDEREHATLDLTWRDTLINFVKIGVGITLITFVVSIISYPIIAPLQLQYMQQLSQQFDRSLLASDMPANTMQQSDMFFASNIVALFINSITSAISFCISLLIRDGILDVVATRILKGQGSIHRFVHKSVRYEIIGFFVSSIMAIVLGLVLINTIFLPLLSRVGTTTPPQPITNNSIPLVLVVFLVVFLGWFIGQAVWLARIIGKVYQFGWSKGCLTQIIPVAFVFGTFFCLCGVIPSILASIAAR